jgi:hypothetical protein
MKNKFSTPPFGVEGKEKIKHELKHNPRSYLKTF